MDPNNWCCWWWWRWHWLFPPYLAIRLEAKFIIWVGVFERALNTKSSISNALKMAMEKSLMKCLKLNKLTYPEPMERDLFWMHFARTHPSNSLVEVIPIKRQVNLSISVNFRSKGICEEKTWLTGCAVRVKTTLLKYWLSCCCRRSVWKKSNESNRLR